MTDYPGGSNSSQGRAIPVIEAAIAKATACPAPADVMTPSSAPELADLLRKRYPRLLERGNPLYDGALAAAVERAEAADVVALRRLAERCYQLDHQPEEHTLGGKCLACEAEDALAKARGK